MIRVHRKQFRNINIQRLKKLPTQGKNLLYMHTLMLKQKGRQRECRDWCQEQIYWLLVGGNTSQHTHALLKRETNRLHSQHIIIQKQNFTDNIKFNFFFVKGPRWFSSQGVYQSVGGIGGNLFCADDAKKGFKKSYYPSSFPSFHPLPPFPLPFPFGTFPLFYFPSSSLPTFLSFTG